jgi:hypothetical protein
MSKTQRECGSRPSQKTEKWKSTQPENREAKTGQIKNPRSENLAKSKNRRSGNLPCRKPEGSGSRPSQKTEEVEKSTKSEKPKKWKNRPSQKNRRSGNRPSQKNRRSGKIDQVQEFEYQPHTTGGASRSTRRARDNKQEIIK